MLDSRRLNIFCTVAEEGSFTAAAVRLPLTQSAVSQQVAMLERSLGVAPMERVARGVKLTQAGQFLAQRARALLRDIAGLEQELHRLANPPSAVTLGVFATAGADIVPMLVQAYRHRHPETQLVLHASQHEDLAGKLTTGEIDAAITWDYNFMPRPVGDLRRQHLFTDLMCPLLPRDHRLAGEPGKLRLAARRYADAFEVMCRIAGFEPRIVFRTEDYPSTQGFVAANVGVAVAPRLSMRAQRPDIVVRPIHEPDFACRIDVVTLRGPNSNPLTQPLLELLTALTPAQDR